MEYLDAQAAAQLGNPNMMAMMSAAQTLVSQHPNIRVTDKDAPPENMDDIGHFNSLSSFDISQNAIQNTRYDLLPDDLQDQKQEHDSS